MVIERQVNGFINSDSIALECQYLNHDVAGSDGAAMAESSGTQVMRSLLFSLSILKEKVHEVESFVNIFLHYHNHNHNHNQPMIELSLSSTSMSHLLQEIVDSASCMMFNCQQMAVGSSNCTILNSNVNVNNFDHHHQLLEHQEQVLVSEQCVNKDVDSFCNWYIPQENFAANNKLLVSNINSKSTTATVEEGRCSVSLVVELDAADLLARYTHYCQVCGRGFKREANLKMHMRAHGEQYKASLMSNNHPKIHKEEAAIKPATRYSCPQEGCRWNKKPAKFQPLKSIVCVRNHYKRSHCPKMFMCKKCNSKQFSVLSDLKTHEKNCGDVTKWYCSCGTSFSKKDKLMAHVALFVGHTPLI